MRGQSAEILEMLFPPNIDICCVQETHWKGESAQKLSERTVIISSFGRVMSWDMMA